MSKAGSTVGPVDFEIIDLPANYEDWRYAPPRRRDFQVRLRGAMVFQRVLTTVQEPLKLKIGDVVRFDEIKDIPPQFMELICRTEAHPVYAVLTTRGPGNAHDKTKTAEPIKEVAKAAAAGPVFVGTARSG